MSKAKAILTSKEPRRRQRHGSAWYWRQTDCWYYTPKGTKKRVPLVDDNGKRIRGKDNKQAAALALARAKLATDWRPEPAEAPAAPQEQWLVAKVSSEYIEYCRHRGNTGTMAADHVANTTRYLNELCKYCGALPIAELKKGHVEFWIDSHPTWRSLATRRNVIAIVLAAFNYAQQEHGIRNPLNGLKKPPPQPRLQSFCPKDEQAIYQATDEPFRNFLFAAIHTGLRPFCELAKLKAEHVEETPRGMMWRVYSSKTKKTRKIPVRPEVAKLTRKLLKTAPLRSGLPLFRNPEGNAWKKVTGVHRFMAIKRKLGWDQDSAKQKVSTYTCRHTFAHRMLSGYWNGGLGCSIEVLAELIGDTPKVAFDHYGKEWGQHYQDPLWAAFGQQEV
jgi:integrase